MTVWCSGNFTSIMRQNKTLLSVFCIERGWMKSSSFNFNCCCTKTATDYMMDQCEERKVFFFSFRSPHLSHFRHLDPSPLWRSCLPPRLQPAKAFINLYSTLLSLNQPFLRPPSSLSPQCAAVPRRKPLQVMFYYHNFHSRLLHSRCLHLQPLTTRAAQAEDSLRKWISILFFPHSCPSPTFRLVWKQIVDLIHDECVVFFSEK